MKSKTGHKKLMKWLKDEKLTQAEGARRIGVTRQAMNKWLKGLPMHQTSAALLANVTGIDRDTFNVTQKE